MKSKKLWELVSLELDPPGREIGEYFEQELGMEIKRVKYKVEGSYYKKAKISTICYMVNEALGESLKRKLVVYGSGNFHHFTYGLCKHVDRTSEDYAYIHFDHHNDTYQRHDNSLDCGSFVRDILKDTNSSEVLLIGSYCPRESRSLLEITDAQLQEGIGLRKLKENLAKLPEEVYLSFDLDVMSRSILDTQFSQGFLGVEELMRYISMIKETKNIIGADVLGYSDAEGKGPGKELYARIVKEILTQDSPNPHQLSNPSEF